MSQDAERWTCQECGTVYVVPTLARDCEKKHVRERVIPPSERCTWCNMTNCGECRAIRLISGWDREERAS